MQHFRFKLTTQPTRTTWTSTQISLRSNTTPQNTTTTSPNTIMLAHLPPDTAHVSLVGFLKNDNVWQSPRRLWKCTCAGSSKPWNWAYPATTPCRSHPVGSLHHQFRWNWWLSCGIHKGSVCKSPRLDQAQQDAFLSQLHQQYRQEMDAQMEGWFANLLNCTSFIINCKCIDAW